MKKHITYILGIIILIGIVIVVTGNTKEPVRNEEGSIKIGHIGILSGPAAAFGEVQLNALTMALEEINADGGINGRDLELVVEDYAYDSKKAIPAYEKLKNQNIDYFLQDGSSGAAVLGARYAQDKVLNIAPSATTEAYFDNDKHTCRLAITADVYSIAVVDQIEKQYGTNAGIGFLVVSNEYGQGFVDGVSDEAGKRGMDIVVTERFEGSATDFRTQITKLRAKEENIDVLLAINVSGSVSTMFQQIQEIGFDKPILSDNWTVLNPAFKNRDNLDKVTFIDYEMNAEDVATQSPKAKSFVDNYVARFEGYPNTFASNGYDAALLYANALRATDAGTPSEIADYFVNDLGIFKGVSGDISFDNSCEVNRNLTVRKVEGESIVSL